MQRNIEKNSNSNEAFKPDSLVLKDETMFMNEKLWAQTSYYLGTGNITGSTLAEALKRGDVSGVVRAPEEVSVVRAPGEENKLINAIYGMKKLGYKTILKSDDATKFKIKTAILKDEIMFMDEKLLAQISYYLETGNITGSTLAGALKRGEVSIVRRTEQEEEQEYNNFIYDYNFNFITGELVNYFTQFCCSLVIFSLLASPVSEGMENFL